MDRKLYELIRGIVDQNLFLRGVVAWADFPSAAIPFKRDARFAGQTKFESSKVVGFALRGIMTQSSKPLRLITVLGFLLSAASAVGLMVLAVLAATVSVPFAGFGTIVGLQVLFFGITVLCIGFVAEYVALIYCEVRRRPHFIVSRFNTYRDS
jgi:dolichol-phosphate mannosyltransferase